MNDEIDKIKVAYFVGIGGIGMSALARFFNSRGVSVSGYDRTETTLTKQLEAEGMAIHYEPSVELIPKNADLVVYTPAVPDDQEALVFYRQHGHRLLKRSDVLEMITESSFNICIAGTHGKTTTTTMIAHLLRDSGYGCNAFLGGICVNYGTNFWPSENNVCVVEADEYDRSFLKLSPDIAVVTAMDPDHLDIYGTAGAMEEAFIEFTQKLRVGGLLVSKFGLKRASDLHADRHLTYSLQNESADAYAENITMKNGSYEFDVTIAENQLTKLALHMGGMHNVENAVAAITVASSLNIDDEKIRRGIENFKGVKRRFEYIIKNERIVFIDDYAHHPEELRALVHGAKTLFRQRRCTIIFQPHLYSRTKDLADGFAEALGLADEIILLPIYPARELPIEGVTSQMILNKMKTENKTIVPKEELVNWIEYNYVKKINREFGEVLITAGAGDIDTLVEPIKEILENI
ncbi:MAG TPA: UDP-N-acetylmuramate--L-alanine ligase [Chitinophagaceae bacterium]|nr:UDP-N-acetylmuramate--L-alanine ligase [Chitinophagaceae bacterium]